MKNKSKKVISIAMSSLLALGVFSGCGNDSSSSNSSSSETTASGEKSGETVKLTVTLWAEPNTDKELDQFYQFGVKNKGYELTPMVIPEDQYSSKINQMIAAGNAPDILTVWECDIQNLADKDYLVKLDDYIAKSTIVKSDDFIPAVADLSKNTGGTYSLPWCYAAEILYYNVDMFDKAGVSYPTNDWTLNDFADAAKKLTIKDSSGAISQYGADGFSFVGGWWSGFGACGDKIYENGKLSIGDGAIKFLTMQKELVDGQYIPAPSADSAGSDLFASGKAAMIRTGSWMVSGYKDLDFKWDIAAQPKDVKSYNSLHTGLYCIPTTTKDVDSAWHAVEWLMGEEGQTITQKGSGNMSVVKSVAANGTYKVQGKNGPSNWSAFDAAASSAAFGYVMLPAGATGDAVGQFQAAVLGQKPIEDAVADAMAKAEEVTG